MITNLGFEQGHLKGKMNAGLRREIQCIRDLPNLSQYLEGSIVVRVQFGTTVFGHEGSACMVEV